MTEAEIKERDDLVEKLKDAEEAIADMERDHEADTAALENALRDVLEWFDRVLVHKLPMTDPRKIATMVERVLRP